jgi:transposase
MAQVLCVYREVQVLKKAAARAKKPRKPVAIVSYDEKPGIQAIATTAPDLPPVPGIHPTFAREHEYKRQGTLSLLAGIDLLTGKVHALVRDRHRSREFVEFLKLLDAAYPASTAIKLILDNHSAHISKETKAWIASQPDGRFEFTFTPKHGSWLNLIESPSSPARSCATSASPQNWSSRNASWRASATSTDIPSSTLGPISLLTRPDMIRTKETLI